MIARGKGGSIVNISSQASKVALNDHTLYCAAKGALDQMTRVMALELGPHQVHFLHYLEIQQNFSPILNWMYFVHQTCSCQIYNSIM